MADVPHTQWVYGLLYRMVKGCVREGPLASTLMKKRTVFSSMYLPSTHSHQHPSRPPTLCLRLMQHLKDLSFLSSLAHVDLEPPCWGYRLAHDHDISFPWGLYFSPRFTPPTALSVACGSFCEMVSAQVLVMASPLRSAPQSLAQGQLVCGETSWCSSHLPFSFFVHTV